MGKHTRNVFADASIGIVLGLVTSAISMVGIAMFSMFSAGFHIFMNLCESDCDVCYPPTTGTRMYKGYHFKTLESESFRFTGMIRNYFNHDMYM